MHKVVSPRGLVILAILAIGLFADVRNVAAQNQEYPLKASFLSLFGELVEWKGNLGLGKTKTLTVGILGSDPFGAVQAGRPFNYLDQQIAKKVQQGRKIEVRRYASLDQYQPCHILFIARDVAEDAQSLQAALSLTRGADVLLVGDTRGLAQQGVTINMVVQSVKNRVQLEINPDAAKRAGLAVDPRLYRLPGVKIVRE